MPELGWLDSRVSTLEKPEERSLLAGGFESLRDVALADPVELHRAIEAARTPRRARNIIPDTFQRIVTPFHARQWQRAAFERCYPLEPGRRPGAPPAPPARPAIWDPRHEREDERRSAHYIVTRRGEIWQLVDDSDVAYHASHRGVGCTGLSARSCRGERSREADWSTDPCSCQSLGIELEGDGFYPYAGVDWVTDEMYRAVANLVRSLCHLHGIPSRFASSGDPGGYLGHVHVAEKRESGKTDPGSSFDWGKFDRLVNPHRFEPPNEEERGGNGGK